MAKSMKAKGFTQIESLCCQYEIKDRVDHVLLDLEFWERNCKIDCITRRTSGYELFGDGIRIDHAIRGERNTVYIERITMSNEGRDVNVEISYSVQSTANDVAEAGASLLNAMQSILHRHFVANPEQSTAAARKAVEEALEQGLAQLSESPAIGPSFNDAMQKMLSISHILFDDKLDEVIAESMKVQTYAAHVQNYLQEVHSGCKPWSEGLAKSTSSSVVKGRCQCDEPPPCWPANSSSSDDSSADDRRRREMSADCDEEEESPETKAPSVAPSIAPLVTEALHGERAPEAPIVEDRPNDVISHHSGDTQYYRPQRRCESVQSRNSSVASYRLNPQTNRFEICALPRDDQAYQPVEVLPKLSYAYCEKKVRGIYKLVAADEPKESDVNRYTAMMRRHELTAHDLLCMLQEPHKIDKDFV